MNIQHPSHSPLTGLTVKQVQRSGPPPAIYQGSIFFPYCTQNPNQFDFKMKFGFEVYQRRGTPENEYLYPVKEVAGDERWVYAGHNVGRQAYIHVVFANETAEEGGLNYTIHLWNEVLDPEPIHRWDFWHNLTFIPYQTEIYYEEGDEVCWLG